MMARRAFTVVVCAVASIASAGGSRDFEDANHVTLTGPGSPAAYRVIDVDVPALRARLSGAPVEFTPAARSDACVVELPRPDGGTASFRVVASPILDGELEEGLPGHRSFVLRGIDDPGATGRLAFANDRVSARIISPSGSWNIERLEGVHASYRADGVSVEPLSCGTSGEPVRFHGGPEPETNRLLSGQIRVLRHALATTGEYTTAQGGVAATMSELFLYVSAANAVLEPNVGVRLELVANNADVVFTDGATDPYMDGDPNQLLSVNGDVLNSIIGFDNYDLGHVFGIGGGGVAAVGGVCSTSKGTASTTASAFDFESRLWVYLHELGHQLNAGHSWNGVGGGCTPQNWSPADAFEPGSGVTAMSYAFLCGSNNLQIGRLRDQFHSRSIATIGVLIDNISCGTLIQTGSAPPVVSVPPDTTIPVNTPFELTATAHDPDGDDLVYSWEQRDRGPQADLLAPDNGESPLFTVRRVSTNPTRVFPRIQVLRGQTTDPGERLPQIPRSMDMLALVRDNTGNTARARMTIEVVDGVGPFNVLFPTASTVIDGPLDVVWTPNGTEGPPTSTTHVDIYLSTDDGDSFTLVAAGAVNDGSHTLQVGPGFNTTQGRIKVKAANSVYFALSFGTFEIAVPDPGCNAADLADPFGELTFGDVSAFVSAFVAQDSAADLAAPAGAYTFGDVSAFLAAFTTGCP